MPEPGFEPGNSGTQTDALPLSQLRVTIVVKLYNCFDAIGRNVNKQGRICGPHIFNIFFSVTCLHARITIFDSFLYLRE